MVITYNANKNIIGVIQQDPQKEEGDNWVCGYFDTRDDNLLAITGYYASKDEACVESAKFVRAMTEGANAIAEAEKQAVDKILKQMEGN